MARPAAFWAVGRSAAIFRCQEFALAGVEGPAFAVDFKVCRSYLSHRLGTHFE
jgi:hypothetical protein